MPSDEQQVAFLAGAAERGLLDLKGHRVRASIYNAMPIEGVRALREFMAEFLASSC